MSLNLSKAHTRLDCIERVLTGSTKNMGTRRVKFPSENALGDCQGVVAGDPSKTRKGLIIIHEWWGMNEHIQEQGTVIAEEGDYVVLIPDLYRGKVAKDREEAGHYQNDLDWQGAIKDIQGAARYLLSLGCRKVGIAGFCMGGALSFASAALVKEISAAAPFYGIPRSAFVDLTTIKIPVQAHFGEKDTIVGFSSPGDYEPLRRKLEAARVPLEFYTYDTGHAFTNSSNKELYSPEACKLAMERMHRFMKKNLA